ncbi:hypothetical protein CASFOL_026880 [Castilleja foliolosa]|uniref:Uncharacterized protein n=1 Tax=Castilleja foliolosa TaxID=1961234 RepID=A0ABD3CJ46_9LAMI
MDDANILTASGDQSVKVWDAQEHKCIRALMAPGRVKSISCHPTDQVILLSLPSGSRDGSFVVCDTRCSENTYPELCLNFEGPSDKMPGAHTSRGRRCRRCGKVESRSITSVLYLKDEVSIATAGAVDSVIKFWDTRHLKGPVTQVCPNIESSTEEKRLHGISSLSQNMNGVFVAASCMDHSISMYVLQLEKGPVKTFSGAPKPSWLTANAVRTQKIQNLPLPIKPSHQYTHHAFQPPQQHSPFYYLHL